MSRLSTTHKYHSPAPSSLVSPQLQYHVLSLTLQTISIQIFSALPCCSCVLPAAVPLLKKSLSTIATMSAPDDANHRMHGWWVRLRVRQMPPAPADCAVWDYPQSVEFAVLTAFLSWLVFLQGLINEIRDVGLFPEEGQDWLLDFNELARLLYITMSNQDQIAFEDVLERFVENLGSFGTLSLGFLAPGHKPRL
ncbi:uncharacterized protein TRUGW13939_08812 [Talaromyces rugulosus]|uniref:Uncharacterized protein n=1 Tax=Talaromyces rugulosus TaxID=121627 RepID=A0A7H8R5M1_TALRU|nr:uncharacterized protein TRUGW13939_08812 [Talaromyces rugulosus]QKX61660.1 hypothetical protein TRUGW13939_08812 [Talaromyces rugulosus]